jgi:hypothetical protein
MSDSREKIRNALLELVARRDATVFQNADVFEEKLKSIGNWRELPEISALKAGLLERFPWELQKDAGGMVTPRTAENLAHNLVKKHSLTEDVAFWAVETWALSLGLKVDLPSRPAESTQAKTPQAIEKPVAEETKTAQFVAPKVEPQKAQPNIAEPDTSSARLGVIFGTDESGLIRVYKSWFGEASREESNKIVATTIKIEPKTSQPLFTAAPKARTKTPPAKTIAKSPAKGDNWQSTAKNSPEMIKTEKNKATDPSVAPTQIKKAPVPEPTPAPKSVTPPEPGADLLARAINHLPGGKARTDVREALNLLQQAVKKGSLAARRKFGEIYLKGIGVKTNLPNAASWYKTAAERGDAESQFQLGSLYQCGVGVECNLEIAQAWLQRAAEQGHPGAKELLNQILQA